MFSVGGRIQAMQEVTCSSTFRLRLSADKRASSLTCRACTKQHQELIIKNKGKFVTSDAATICSESSDMLF
jgi:hypothetical protein